MTQSTKEKWCLTLSAGGFLFFVLYIYEGFGIPPGMSDTGHGLLFRAASFGLLACITVGLHEFFLKKGFKTEELSHRIIWYAWELMVIWNLTYILINIYWSWGSFSWFAYADLLGEMTAVMIVPFTMTEIYRRLNRADSDREEKLVFQSSNEKESLMLDPDQFLYASSSDNYVEIFYLEDDEVKKVLQRNTLKSIEDALVDVPAIIRCHRSFIINPRHVRRFNESSRGGEVVLSHDIKLPVSKKQRDRVRDAVMPAD